MAICGQVTGGTDETKNVDWGHDEEYRWDSTDTSGLVPYA